MAAARWPLGSVTRIEDGCWTKLKALDTTYPSAATTNPVVGPALTSTRPTCSSPPMVSTRSTAGATWATAALTACSSNDSRSSAA